MRELSILVVDDEEHVRKKLISFLKNENVDKIAEASNGIEAVKIINEKNIDLVFLDIQMPKMQGLEVAESIEQEKIPVIVFVTAYDQYAVDAFEMGAVDYLLKPFDKERFQKAYRRALEKIEAKSFIASSINEVLAKLKPGEKYNKRFLVNKSSKYFFVNADDIYFISAQEKYIELNTENEKFLLRGTMNGMEEKLDPSKFKRSHRSYIVNVDNIKEIQSWSHGDYLLIMKNGEKVKLSRRYKTEFFEE